MRKLAIYHLETLLWIARLGTFRAAAERLGTTQPAISARVREVEQQLGIALFRREGRGVVLTARGRQLVQDCEPLLAGFERALLTAGDFAGARGVVRLGAGEIAAASCLPGFVAGVSRDLPGVTLEIDLDLTARMLQHLLAGTRDLVFLAGPVASPGVLTAPIGEVALVWLASPATVATGGFARPLPVWSVGAHSPIHQVLLAELAAGLPSRSINVCNNVQTMIGIVAGGGDEIECLVHRPRTGEMIRMGFAGIDDGFELGVGQNAVGDDAGGERRPIAWLRRCDRGHRRRLDQLGRVRLRAGNPDRLKPVFLINGVGQPATLGRRPVDGFIGEFDALWFGYRSAWRR